MINIDNLHVKLADTDKLILSGVNLIIGSGEVHILNGKNGSGKSTLAQVLSGSPKFEVTSGSIELDTKDVSPSIKEQLELSKNTTVNLLDYAPNERSKLGIFHANQYPLEIPGVNLSNFLRMAYNSRRKEDIPPFKFRRLLKERAAIINYPEELLDRNLNEGFSGGEKKKTEVLQLAVLEPRLAILDETDSGLDPHAVIEVLEGIKQLRKTILPNMSLLIITHYQTPLDIIKPDFVHTMEGGKLL